MIITNRRLNLPADKTIRAPVAASGPNGDAVDPADTTIADQFSSYVMHDDDLRLAIEVALATRRALLLQGPSGSGKSAVAQAVAIHLGWRFYRSVITSRTSAEDLLWTVDHVRRIGDAQASTGEVDLSTSRYISPGVLWWAFDPVSAATIGGNRTSRLPDPSRFGQEVDAEHSPPAVVLLDEIDKADADMPNDLLVPLGSMEFGVDVLDHRDDAQNDQDNVDLRSPKKGFRVTAASGQEPLVVITSNQERDLSPAFLRRCVQHDVGLPEPAIYREIASNQVTDASSEVVDRLVKHLVSSPRDRNLDAANIATFVDAVRAATELNIDPTTDEGERLIDLLGNWEPNDRSRTSGRPR